MPTHREPWKPTVTPHIFADISGSDASAKLSMPPTSTSTEESPLNHQQPGDLSRLSGYPHIPQLGLGLNEPPPPTTNSWRLHKPSKRMLSSKTPSFSMHSAQKNTFHDGVHVPQASPSNESDELPPPYSQYAGPNPMDGSPIITREQPLPIITRPQKIPTTLGSCYPKIAPASEPPGIGNQRLLPLTLHDLRIGRDTSSRQHRQQHRLEAERNREENSLQRRNMWIKRGCIGVGEGSFSQKRPWSTNKRSCLIALITIPCLILAITLGIIGPKVFKKISTKDMDNSLDESVPLLHTGFPPFPKSNIIIHPYATPEVQTTCVTEKETWSCELPPDTQFVTTISKSDNRRVPEFNFVVKNRQNKKKYSANSSWEPNPSISDVQSYKNVARVDEINGNPEGEETPFIISFGSIMPKYSPGNFNNKPANMLPQVLRNQPIRLFDRNLTSEHYGFHIYFQKTIHLGTDKNESGGASLNDTKYTVVWDDTRFRVAIFTMPKKLSGGQPPVSIREDREGNSNKELQSMKMFRADGTPERITAEMSQPCICHWKNYPNDILAH
ncbi:hypothetical protein EDC01DRAFT_652171, partial [Geopyxis carbonaria]